MVTSEPLRAASAGAPGLRDARHAPHWERRESLLLQYLKALGVVGALTVAAFAFTPVVGPHATALVFLLTIVMLALFLERGPTLFAAALSAVLWDYFFLAPLNDFRIAHFEDAMLFGMYFVVALVLGHLTTRIRAQQEADQRREELATALYLLTRDLNEPLNLDQMIEQAARHMETAFQAQVAVLLPGDGNTVTAHPAGTFMVPEEDAAAPGWVLEHRQPAGKFTGNLSAAAALYVPMLSGAGTVGVVGLKLTQAFPLTIHQQNLLDAMSQQIALALEKLRLGELGERARLLAESERLSKTLLDSMSHEIRTPIAAIQGAMGNLKDENLSDFQRAMIDEIQEAAERLNRLVGNVLEASRLESGTVKPRCNECDVADLVNVAVSETAKQLSRHSVTVELAPELPVVRMDFVLMEQVLVNLLSNAAAHTPPGTALTVGARLHGGMLLLTVADRGPGIPAESRARIFEKFYRAPNAPTGGTGLGLSLVRGFVEAQGGRVRVDNRPGGGAIFTVSLPAGKTEAAQPAMTT